LVNKYPIFPKREVKIITAQNYKEIASKVVDLLKIT
jgi:hypothetical protein